MIRKPLQERFACLENNHADDPAYWIQRVRRLRRMPMSHYFFRDRKPIEALSGYIGIPADDVEKMTYEEVADRIEALYSEEETSDDATEAVCCLARTYVTYWRKRRNEK